MSQQINLFSPELLPRKPRFTAAAMVQAVALLVVGSLAIYAYEVRQNRALQKVAAQSEQQLGQRRNDLQRLTKQLAEHGQSGALTQEIAGAEERLRQRQQILAEIETAGDATAQGFSPFLVALARRRPDGMWLTGLTIGGGSSDVVIKGRTLDGSLVPAYIHALNREGSFSGRTVTELKLAAQQGPAGVSAGAQPAAPKPPTSFVEFSVSLRPGPGAHGGGETARKGAS